MATVSILMPTYNGGLYCRQQLDSISNQSFSDWELLVIDDGSSDNTIEYITDACVRDNRIRLISSNGKNHGQKSRLRALLSEAKGELIAFADQDDIWEPYKIERLVNGLNEAGMAFGPSHIIDDTDQQTGQTLHSALGIEIRPQDRLRSLVQPLVSAHSMVVRREIISDVVFCQRAPFDWLIGLDAQYTSGIRYISDAITLHRVHNNNQNNGDILNGHDPLHWRFRIALPRSFLSSGNRDRFSFWSRAVYLANSPVVAADVRRAFSIICKTCEDAWFISQPPFYRLQDDRCKTILHEYLEPFSGSPQDWKDCQNIIDLLTSNWKTRHSRYMFL